MSKPQHLFLRKNTYYFKIRVPQDLRKAYKTEVIVKSLGTSNYAEAKKRLNAARVKQDAEFEEKRLTLHGNTETELSELSEAARTALYLKWLSDADLEGKKQALLPKGDDFIWEEVSRNLLEDIGQAKYEIEARTFNIGRGIAKRLLKQKHIAFDEKSPEFLELAAMLTRAYQETVTRQHQRYEGKRVVGTRDPAFIPHHPHQEAAKTIVSNPRTFGQVCKEYIQEKADGTEPLTVKGMKDEIALLQQFIPAGTYIQEINRTMCIEVRDLLKQTPTHAAKKYPGKPIKKAIALAKADGLPTLGPARINTYFDRLKSVLEYAVDADYISKNPARKITVKDTRSDKAKRDAFAVEQLQKMFHAPLYAGCVDDENGSFKTGTNRPRRHRFWIPLIALWSGLRLEEICQLYVDDIGIINGIHVIRTRLDEEGEKRIKTESSERIVPIHPELEKLGFLEYVAKVKSQNHKRLFPDIERGANGKLGHNFSKWFRRFQRSLGIKDKKLVFHSFRHTLAVALENAEVEESIANALCGWKGKSMYERYGKGRTVENLYSHLKKVAYPGLDLSHLYP